MSSAPPEFQPSTADSGYRLTPCPIQNPFTSDPVYRRIISWHLPPAIYAEIAPKLEHFATEAISQQVTDWIANAESHPPTVKQYDIWGHRNPIDKALTTSEGWRRLGAWGAANGVVAHGYEDTYGPYRRIVQHSFNYIFNASSAVRSCPVSMTSGAARLLGKLLPDLPATHPFHKVYAHLISRTDPWVSAQWMTERPGGSDVQNSETTATYSPLPSTTTPHPSLYEGDHLLNGFKWFSSATDSDIALILARTSPGSALSLFLAPTRLPSPSPTDPPTSNGIHIHRLKPKLGTHPLPTSELLLTNVRAHLVGAPERGIATIATLLNVTRTHNVFVALSCWRRGLSVTKSFAAARRTLDQPLGLIPMHLRLLAGLEVKLRAATHLGVFTTALLSYVDNGHPPPAGGGSAADGGEEGTRRMDGVGVPLPQPGKQTEVLLRALTATAKAVVCKVGCAALQECAEGMGGVGYLDDPAEVGWNISRLYRDTAANMTWEGTTNVLASEVVRHLGREGNLREVGEWVRNALGVRDEGGLCEGLVAAWEVLEGRLGKGRGETLGRTLADGRELMFSFAWVISGVLLVRDAQRDGDLVAWDCARRWVTGDAVYGEWVLSDVKAAAKERALRKELPEVERRNWDCRIVWGRDLPADAALGYRPSQAKL